MAIRRPSPPSLFDEVRFRPMTQGDLDEVVAIECRLFDDPWPWITFATEFLGQKNATNIVAVSRYDEEAILGYVIFIGQGFFTHLANIAVVPEMRGRGLGKSLLALCTRKAVERDRNYVSLEVRTDNEEAIALYERFGFREMGVKRHYYGPNEDAFIMALNLRNGGSFRNLALLHQEHYPPPEALDEIP